MKKISKTYLKKILTERDSKVEVRDAEGEDVIYVDVEFKDGSKTTIEIKKYIPFEESAKMILSMAADIAGEQEVNGEMQYLYRPYMNGWLSGFYFLNYFTNISVTIADQEALNKFFMTSNIWEKLSEKGWELSQLVSIFASVNEMVEYNNKYYINTQAQEVKALEQKLNETVDKLESMSDVLTVFAENYSDIDKETTNRLIDSINKIMSVDENEVAEKVASYIEQRKNTEEKSEPQEIDVTNRRVLTNKEINALYEDVTPLVKDSVKQKRGRKSKKVVEESTSDTSGKQE